MNIVIRFASIEGNIKEILNAKINIVFSVNGQRTHFLDEKFYEYYKKLNKK